MLLYPFLDGARNFNIDEDHLSKPFHNAGIIVEKQFTRHYDCLLFGNLPLKFLIDFRSERIKGYFVLGRCELCKKCALIQDTVRNNQNFLLAIFFKKLCYEVCRRQMTVEVEFYRSGNE